MKIQKSKSIRLQITCLTSGGIVFSVALVYFLGWDFDIKSFSIALGVLVALLFALWLLCYLLIKFECEYYVIEKEQITLWRKDKTLCALKKEEMMEMSYVRFVRALIMQMGSGYLLIACRVEALPDKKFAEIIMPNGVAIFAIAMSKKQAKQCAIILGKQVKIQ